MLRISLLSLTSSVSRKDYTDDPGLVALRSSIIVQFNADYTYVQSRGRHETSDIPHGRTARDLASAMDS